jgi:hypothetical protein
MCVEICDRTEDHYFTLGGQNENEILVQFWKPVAVMSLVKKVLF